MCSLGTESQLHPQRASTNSFRAREGHARQNGAAFGCSCCLVLCHLAGIPSVRRACRRYCRTHTMGQGLGRHGRRSSCRSWTWSPLLFAWRCWNSGTVEQWQCMLSACACPQVNAVVKTNNEGVRGLFATREIKDGENILSIPAAAIINAGGLTDSFAVSEADFAAVAGLCSLLLWVDLPGCWCGGPLAHQQQHPSHVPGCRSPP